MKLRKIAGSYAVLMGVAMIAMWTAQISAGQVPEIETEPIRISFHLAGEFMTATTLIVGGLGLYRALRWGFNLYLVSLGMLSYTVVVSPGYYGQEGEYGFVAMFAAFTAITAVLIAYALRDEALFTARSREKGQ